MESHRHHHRAPCGLPWMSVMVCGTWAKDVHALRTLIPLVISHRGRHYLEPAPHRNSRVRRPNSNEQVIEDPGVQQVEVAEQELIEGEEQVVQEEPYNEEFELI
ncbi:uncharacterized protein [Zea mays]|uniref:uncharacterized protein n=1 Tax=Zea mays TaxID=4577 RepID=UPI001653124B|nr:uncharacterized protein LOC118472945 [Zea mays]